MLFQNADDLVFGEPDALHLWSLRFGQRLPQLDSVDGATPTRQFLLQSPDPGVFLRFARGRLRELTPPCMERVPAHPEPR